MDKYQKIEKIGQGSVGIVYKAKDKETDVVVALKRISVGEEFGIPQTALREISMLKELKHKNILKLLNVFYNNRKLTLIFEYMDLDLARYIKAQKVLDTELIRLWMYQLFVGISHCHMRGVLHRDLKPGNILIDSNKNIRIADFGLSRFHPPETHENIHYSKSIVTLWYRPPDVLLNAKSYSFSIDIWSIGCIFAELFLGSPIFPGKTVSDQLTKIFKLRGTPTPKTLPNFPELKNYLNKHPQIEKITPFSMIIPDMDPLALDLLEKCLEYCPEKRITGVEALNHAYFHSIAKHGSKSN